MQAIERVNRLAERQKARDEEKQQKFKEQYPEEYEFVKLLKEKFGKITVRVIKDDRA